MKKFVFLIPSIFFLTICLNAQCPDTYEPSNNTKSSSNQTLLNQMFYTSKLSSNTDIDYWKYNQTQPTGFCNGKWQHTLSVDPMGNSVKIDVINATNNIVYSGTISTLHSIVLPYGAFHIKVYKATNVTTNHCYTLMRSFGCSSNNIPDPK